METSSDKKSKLSTEQWKKWVLNGMDPDDEPSKDDLMKGKPTEPIFFLIFDPDHDSETKTCVLLDPLLGGQTRSFDLIHDTLVKKNSTFDPQLVSFNSDADISRFRQVLDKVLKKVSFAIKKENSQISDEQIYELVMTKCKRFAGKKLNTPLVKMSSMFPVEMCPSSVDDSAQIFGFESNWEERRFLALLEHNRRLAYERKLKLSNDKDATMKPSGDFVVMEAKELVKLFDPDGAPKAGIPLQPIPVTKLMQNSSLKEDLSATKKSVSSPSSWPQVLWTNFPDLYYNRDEKSETRDRDLAKLQQIYVGLRETVSTCNSQNSSKDPEVISKPSFQNQNQNQNQLPKLSELPKKPLVASKPAVPTVVAEKRRPRYPASVIRKSPRKQPMQANMVGPPSVTSESARLKSNDTQEVFKKKLRHAVYIALTDRKIGEKSPLFRPCFKKLFDICMMYGQDLPAKVKTNGGTQKWLLTIAEQNADTVIKLEKSLKGIS